MPTHNRLVPKGVMAKIKRHKDAIAKHRDALREIYEDIECVIDSTDDAVVMLESAIDILSQYV